MDILGALLIVILCSIRIVVLKTKGMILHGTSISCEECIDSTTLHASKYKVKYIYREPDGKTIESESIINSPVDPGAEFNVISLKNGNIVPYKQLNFLKTIIWILLIYCVFRITIPLVLDALTDTIR